MRSRVSYTVVMSVLSLIVMIVTIAMEEYKFELFQMCAETNRSYYIFPWSTNPDRSLSNPNWLWWHLLSAISHIGLSYLRLITDDPVVVFLHSLSHGVFCILIGFNINHFGTFSLPIALAANGVPLALAVWYFPYWGKFKLRQYLIYLGAITSPIIFELLMRGKQMIS